MWRTRALPNSLWMWQSVLMIEKACDLIGWYVQLMVTRRDMLTINFWRQSLSGTIWKTSMAGCCLKRSSKSQVKRRGKFFQQAFRVLSPSLHLRSRAKVIAEWLLFKGCQRSQLIGHLSCDKGKPKPYSFTCWDTSMQKSLTSWMNCSIAWSIFASKR